MKPMGEGKDYTCSYLASHTPTLITHGVPKEHEGKRKREGRMRAYIVSLRR